MPITKANPEMPESEETSTGETATVPVTIIGDQSVSPGDKIQLEVVSVDGDTITVKYAEPMDQASEGEAEPDMMQMANKFNERK
jgi:hypothetical protein